MRQGSTFSVRFVWIMQPLGAKNASGQLRASPRLLSPECRSYKARTLRQLSLLQASVRMITSPVGTRKRAAIAEAGCGSRFTLTCPGPHDYRTADEWVHD